LFDIKPETGQETALICGELYRRGEGWKFRALGEGYSNGLRGLATDFGISVDESEAAEEPAADPAAQAPAPPRALPEAPTQAHAPAAPEVSGPLPPEQPAAGVPAQPAYGYPPQQPPAAQPAYGYPHPAAQPAYGYPQQPPAAAPAAYGFPPAGSAPDPGFRLPPQGPRFIGRYGLSRDRGPARGRPRAGTAAAG